MSYSLTTYSITNVQIVTPETGLSPAGQALNDNFKALAITYTDTALMTSLYSTTAGQDLYGFGGFYGTNEITGNSVGGAARPISASDTGVVSIWQFDGNLNDSVGSQNWTGSVAYSNAYRVGGQSLNGWCQMAKPASLSISYSSAPSSNAQWQLAGWVWIPSPSSSVTANILSVGSSSTDTSPYLEVYATGGTLYWNVPGWGTSSGVSLSAGWHFISLTGGYYCCTNINYLALIVDGNIGSAQWTDTANSASGHQTNLYLGMGHRNSGGAAQGLLFDQWAYWASGSSNVNPPQNGVGANTWNNSLTAQYAAYPILNFSQMQNYRNYLIGYGVPYPSSSGTDNVVIGDGAFAGSGGQACIGNVVIGCGGAMNAFQPNNNYNVVIGYGAMSIIQNQGENSGFVAIGYQAMWRGNQNTATAYTDCIAIGTLSHDLHRGNHNIAIGASALSGNSTGDGNICIGASAGVNCEQYNTIIGCNAGANALTTSSANNVMLGAYAGFNASSSNELYVNNVQQSSNANEKAYSLLYGNFSGSAGSLSGQQLTVNGELNVNSTTGTYTGSTSGTATYTQPFGGATYKKVLIYLNALTDAGGTITFPTAFTKTPAVATNTTGLTISTVTTTAVTLPASTAATGWIILEGF